MDDEELVALLIRCVALHCATAGVNWRTDDAIERAQRFEAYLRGGDEDAGV